MYRILDNFDIRITGPISLEEAERALDVQPYSLPNETGNAGAILASTLAQNWPSLALIVQLAKLMDDQRG